MKKNKLVFIPLAHKEHFLMAKNVVSNSDVAVNLYIKNAFVSLMSVKNHNKDVDVALVTNINIPDDLSALFIENSILIISAPFDSFCMPPDNRWSLTFYKICALKYIIEHLDYEYVLELECDMYCFSPFSDLWQDMEDKVFMLENNFRYNHPNRILYSEIYHKCYNDNSSHIISKAGCGFIGGKRHSLFKFIEECSAIYNYLQNNISQISKEAGDELYTSLYFSKYPERVRNAGAYVDVYWTGNFYYTSTNYIYDAVSIVHLPDEKNLGMIMVFDYFIKHRRLPSNKVLYSIFCFPKPKPGFSFRKFGFRLKRKLKKYLHI